MERVQNGATPAGDHRANGRLAVRGGKENAVIAKWVMILFVPGEKKLDSVRQLSNIATAFATRKHRPSSTGQGKRTTQSSWASWAPSGNVLIFCHFVELNGDSGQSSKANRSAAIPYVIDNKCANMACFNQIPGGSRLASPRTEGGSLSIKRVVTTGIRTTGIR